MEEMDRQTDAELDRLNITATGLSNFSWPDLGIDDSSNSSEGVEIQDRQPIENVLFLGDGSSNPVMSSNIDSDHVNTDCDSDDDDITAGGEGVYNFLDKMSLNEAIRYWAIIGNLPRSSLNMLLAILRKKLNLDLPKDARTFLKTPTRIGLEVQQISGGDFWYQGVETVLRGYFRNVVPEVETFSLQVSIDGLPLFRSSSRQLWPILIKVEELPDAPVMLVAVFCGLTKPELVEEFLRPLVLEVNDLQQRGMLFGDKQVRIKLHGIIADAPARSFAKGKRSRY
ncbi:uncharacterized protein LOC125768845 [Anopheles funestus]|uniref:uncharacterized protein LOC125768845 n=1 Tax=Anopheles funestus TaxID=62324 RepID=UPI0020C5E77D|nr:uncharacterized protein LOC125768845 [Anopheles funestus]